MCGNLCMLFCRVRILSMYLVVCVLYIVCVCKFNQFLVTCKSVGELVGLPHCGDKMG